MRHNSPCIVLSIALLVLSTASVSAQERWVYRYNGPGDSVDAASSIVIGTDGNLYAAGWSTGSGTYYDFTVVSLDTSGTERWVYRYNGPGDTVDVAHSIVMGTDGHVYAAGYSQGSGTQEDFAVISLDSSGAERWVYHYNGPADGLDVAYAIVMGTDGNLYVAGCSWGSGTEDDFTVISLTPLGGQRWVYRYNGPYMSYEAAVSIEAGTDGNVYAAGRTDRWFTDFTVISLDTSGTERWVYQYDEGYPDEARSVTMGSDGNLYAAGTVGRWAPHGVRADAAVISLTPSGDERWVSGWWAEVGARANSVVMGSDGNLYAAGYRSWWDTGFDFVVYSWTSSGAGRWSYSYDPGAGWEEAYCIVMGTDGNLYAAGRAGGGFSIISLTPSGGERWVYTYGGAGCAPSIVAGTDGNLYTAGWSYRTGTDFDFTVISLGPEVGIQEPDAGSRMPDARLRLSVSPIPAVSRVTVAYSLSEAVKVTLAIYDVCGELIKKLVNAREEVGSKTVVWDRSDSGGHRAPSGTYFVRLQSADFSATRKLILLQ